MAKRIQTQKFQKSKGPKKNPLFERTRASRGGRMRQINHILRSDLVAAIGTTLGIVFIFWYVIIYLSIFHIQRITVDDTTYLPRDKVVTIVDDYLNSKRLWLLPARSYVFFSAPTLEKHIKDAFAQEYAIESIDINSTFPSSLKVTIHERVPQVIWHASNSPQENYYLVDRQGVVTQYKEGQTAIPDNLPQVYDKNRTELTTGSLAASQAYIEYILSTYEEFERATELPIIAFDFPKVECKELQYVMEEIFQDEIQDSASDTFRQKKLAIQEKFKNGNLTIDQSLDELERIKKEEIAENGSVNNGASSPKMRWQQVSVTVPCNYGEVSKELHVITKTTTNQFAVYLDAQLELSTQLYNFSSAVKTGTVNPDLLSYFDARYSDRAFYKNK